MQNMEFKTLKADQLLDVRGLTCPQPLIKAKKALELLPCGHVLEVHGTCPGSMTSFPQWAERSGNQYLGMVEELDFYRFFLKKG